MECKLELICHNSAGIVMDIVRLLTCRGAEVKAFTSKVESAQMSGDSMVLINALLSIENEEAMENIREELESISNELMVDYEPQN